MIEAASACLSSKKSRVAKVGGAELKIQYKQGFVELVLYDRLLKGYKCCKILNFIFLDKYFFFI